VLEVNPLKVEVVQRKFYGEEIMLRALVKKYCVFDGFRRELLKSIGQATVPEAQRH
jgi:hypothetical protein